MAVSPARRACIDVGSNTTRLLVADCVPGRLRQVHQQRAFTRLGHGLKVGGRIPGDKLESLVQVVAGQLRTARALGATEVHGVGTAAIRRAANGEDLLAAIRSGCGLEVRVLAEQDEARLAFIGAVARLPAASGPVGVVDVGGGSSELVTGVPPDQVSWCTSLPVGSADLSHSLVRSDPPSDHELSLISDGVQRVLDSVRPPPPRVALAVGGSATSLRRLAGDVLDQPAFERALALLAGGPAAEVARRFGLEAERVRLLPAGLMILRAASTLFGAKLQIAFGGIREGVLLEASR